MKSEREEELTLTPSGFLFSRLLAAVEKEKKMTARGKLVDSWNYNTKQISRNAHTCTVPKAEQLGATLKWAPARTERREEKCKSIQEIK